MKLTLKFIFVLIISISPQYLLAQVGSPFDVVPLTEVTHTANQSGQWTDPTTWDLGVPPQGAKVFIPQGTEVVIDQIISQRIKTIRLEGRLIFSSNNITELKVETIVGGVNSELLIGSSISPIASNLSAKILFIDEGPLDLQSDEGQFGKGLVSLGKVEMSGQEKLTWTSLAISPNAGSTSLALSENPSGWEIGDEIVIAATKLGDPESDEKRTITSINGNTVGFDTPLDIDHIPPPGQNLTVHVANLSRNVVLESENESIDRRAHIMFMHSLNVSLEYVRMFNLGRTDKRIQIDDWSFPGLVADEYVFGDRTNIRGRYSCHFHRGGVNPNTTTAALIKGCVVENDPGWAYVNHSSNVDFIDNVSYDVVGGAFQTESGDEIGSFVHNIALRTVNPDYPLLDPAFAPVDIRESSQDFAFQGDGFWFHGGGVSISENVSSGNSGHGFIFWTEGQREVGTPFDLQNMFRVENINNGNLLPDLEYIQSWWVPVQEFRSNTAYATTNGFAAYYVHATLFEDITELSADYLETVHTTFEDLTIWNSNKFGVELQNCERFTFQNLKIINETIEGDTEGIRCWQTVSNESNWFDIEINGFEIGMIPPMQGKVQICGGKLTNEFDFLLIPPQRDSRAQGDIRDILIADIQFGEESSFYNLSNETPIKMHGAEVLIGNVSFLDPQFASKYFLIPDRIRVDLDAIGQKTLYYTEQAPNHVSITPLNIGDATGVYANLIENSSNQHLYNQAGLAFAGGISPTDINTHPFVEGGVISDTDIQRKIPSCHFIQEGYFPADYFDNFDFFDCWELSSASDHMVMQNGSFSLCENITNIQEPDNLHDDLVIFPNPSKNGVFNIVKPSDLEIKDISVVNALGQKVNQNLEPTQNIINLDGTPPGVYFAIITFWNNDSCAKKIVVN